MSDANEKKNAFGLSSSANKDYDSALKFVAADKRKIGDRPSITLESINGKINAVTPGELFWQYAKSGFLYPKKKRKLTPYIEAVEANWRKALGLGEDIFWIGTVFDEKSKSWASICNWRTTLGGWVSQHLVSSGNAAYPLLLMLGTQTKVINETAKKPYDSFQNWFRPTNKYANKVFGYLAENIKKSAVELKEFQYFIVERQDIQNTTGNDIKVLKCDNRNPNGVIDYLKKHRSLTFMNAEELLSSDIELCELDELYRRAGLQRKRSFWLAYDGMKTDPCAAIIIYRAPMGINFSMIENRCELIVDTGLSETTAINVCLALLAKAKEMYTDFLPSFIPLVSDSSVAKILEKINIKTVRSYNQFIWTKEGYQDWYNALWDISEHSIHRWMRTRNHDGGNDETE